MRKSVIGFSILMRRDLLALSLLGAAVILAIQPRRRPFVLGPAWESAIGWAPFLTPGVGRHRAR